MQLIYYSGHGVILTYSCFQPSTNWLDQNIASSSMKCLFDMYVTPWVGILRSTMSYIWNTTACVTRVYVGFNMTAHTRPKKFSLNQVQSRLYKWDWWATLIICFVVTVEVSVLIPLLTPLLCIIFLVSLLYCVCFISKLTWHIYLIIPKKTKVREFTLCMFHVTSKPQEQILKC